MRRVVLAGPERIVVEDAPDVAPGPAEILVAPDAVGICGTDIELLDGSMAYLTQGLTTYPLVPGHEWTGIVEAVGPGVEGFAAGERVVGEVSLGCGSCERCRAGAHNLCARRSETGLLDRDGAMATRLRFPARIAHRVPPAVDRLDAVLIEPLAVACRALSRAPSVPARVAVVGGGTIGLLSALAARALGAREVVVVEPHEERRAFAASLGFEAVDSAAAPAPLVVEAAGAPSAIATALSMCDAGGTVVVLGLTGTRTVPLDLDAAVLNELTIVGSLSSPGVWPEAIELVASGRVNPSVLVSHTVPLDDAREAFALVRARAPGTRKVVVLPTEKESP